MNNDIIKTTGLFSELARSMGLWKMFAKPIRDGLAISGRALVFLLVRRGGLAELQFFDRCA